MRLRTNEFCPIHRSLSCCGREFLPKPKVIRLGVQRIEDPHHPRGYRELRSPAEMRKLLNRKFDSRRVYVRSATKSFAIITTSSPTIGIRKEWAEGGGTIIRTTSRQYIGGVTKRRDQSEWISEGSVAGGFEYCFKADC